MKQDMDINQGIGGRYSKLKLAWHRKKMQALLEGRVSSPIYVRVKPTNICNHGCFYCVYETDFSGIHDNMNRRDQIPREKLMEMLQDFKDMGVLAVTYSGGGEPLVHPDINEALEQTLNHGIDLSIITNGQRLNGRSAELLGRAHWVRVSLDYTNPKTFTRIRKRPGSWFDEIEKNMQDFSMTKDPDCDFEANFVVNEHNANEVYDAAVMLKDWGLTNVRFAPVWSPEMGRYHAPFKERVIEQLDRAKAEIHEPSVFEIGESYRRDFEISGRSERTFPRCYFMEIVPAVGADQVVYTCHNKAYDGSGAIGSVKTQSFRDMWFSDETAEFFKNFDPRTTCNHQCSNDEKNRIYQEIMDCADPRVVNFP